MLIVLINNTHTDPTGVPQNVMADAASSTSITLSWQAPLADLQNGIIRSYYISVVELETGNIRPFVTSGVDRVLVVNLLHPFYNYNCSIAAYTIGLGPSIFVSVQTLQEGMRMQNFGIGYNAMNSIYQLESENPKEVFAW